MRQDEIDDIVDGSEIDALIAEKVMGWHKEVDKDGWASWKDAEGHYQHHVAPDRNQYSNGMFEDDEDFHLINWHPSGSMLWAWSVVEKMEEMDFSFTMTDVLPNSDPIAYEVYFSSKDKKGYACEMDAPLAICKAALVAVSDK